MYLKVMLTLLVAMAGVITVQLFRMPVDQFHPPSKSLVVAADLGSRGGVSSAPAIEGDAIWADEAISLLERVIPSLDIDSPDVGTALDQFKRQTGENVVGPATALPVAVRMRIENVTVRTALRTLLDQTGTGLRFYATDNVIVVTGSMDDRSAETRCYNVRWLTSQPWPAPPPAPEPPAVEPRSVSVEGAELICNRMDSIEQLVMVINSKVAPETWVEAGGAYCHIDRIAGVLVITQTPENHREIVRLLRSVHRAMAAPTTCPTNSPVGDAALPRQTSAPIRSAG